MKKLVSLAISLKEKIFGPKEKQAESKEEHTKSIGGVINRFYSEGFSFWRDPYDTYRRNFTVRAGP